LIATETAALGLQLVTEIPVKLPRGGGPLRIRSYEGTDALGRTIHAVRVASAHAVVMALGPLDPGDPDRMAKTALVPALVQEAGSRGVGAFRSGTDLAGDGAVSVVVRNDAGHLAIWRIAPLGASPYPIALVGQPTRGLDADGDGRVDLVSEVPVDASDPIAPRLTDVATFDGAGFSNRTEGARAFHAALAEPAGTPTTSDEVRLRGAIEHAWHSVLAGRSKEDALKQLGREVVPVRLRAAVERWTAAISSILARSGARTPDER
jgi:hypothetical protein